MCTAGSLLAWTPAVVFIALSFVLCIVVPFILSIDVQIKYQMILAEEIIEPEK